jgi:hypothetical protein
MAMPVYAKFMTKVYADSELATEGYKKMPFTKPENFQFDFSCSGEIPVDSSAILLSKTKKTIEIQE